MKEYFHQFSINLIFSHLNEIFSSVALILIDGHSYLTCAVHSLEYAYMKAVMSQIL